MLILRVELQAWTHIIPMQVRSLFGYYTNTHVPPAKTKWYSVVTLVARETNWYTFYNIIEHRLHVHFIDDFMKTKGNDVDTNRHVEVPIKKEKEEEKKNFYNLCLIRVKIGKIYHSRAGGGKVYKLS